MSRKGNCWDTAPTESFCNNLKNERVPGTCYTAREVAKADIFDHFKVFYYQSRRHYTLGSTSPIQFSKNWISTQPERNLAA